MNPNEMDQEAINQLLGGLPPDFDSKSPEYQMAWLRRKIPEFKKQIAEEEARVGDQNQKLETELQPAAEKVRDLAKRRRAASEQGMPWPRRPPDTPGFFQLLGSMVKAAALTGASSLIDEKRKILMDMEAREEALSKKYPPAPSTKLAPPSPEQQRAQSLTNVAALEAERDKVLPTISDPSIRQAVKHAFQQRIQDELKKL